MTSYETRRGRALLLLGAVVGVGASLASMVTVAKAPSRVDDGAFAVVNGHPLSRAELERGVEALAAERPGIDHAELRRHVAARLVDEQLLVEAALELGLPSRDARLRADLGAATIGMVTAAAEAEPVTREEVERFYAAHAGYFRRGGRAQVEHLAFSLDDADAVRRVEGARTRWQAGTPAGDIATEALPRAVRVPATPLSRDELARYLGATLADAAFAIEVGRVSPPLRVGNELHLLLVSKRQEGVLPPLSEVEEVVKRELLRRRSEARLREFLAARRARAKVDAAQGVL